MASIFMSIFSITFCAGRCCTCFDSLDFFLFLMSIYFKEFLLVSTFALSHLADNDCDSCPIGSGMKKMRREFELCDACKDLAAVFGALLGTKQHSEKEPGFLAIFICLFFSSHLSKHFALLLKNPLLICPSFRVLTICWMQIVWGIGIWMFNLNAEFDLMVSSTCKPAFMAAGIEKVNK